MPDVIGEAFVAIRPLTTGFAAEAETGLGTTLKKLATFAAGAFAVAKVKDFFGSAIAEGTESNKVAAQTDAVIKSIGKGAHVSAGQVGELSTSISNKVGIDDEAIQSGENLLLTFRNIRNETGKGNDIFTRATKASVDLSVAWKTDMKSASIQLGKALNDPIQGITALQRVGVQFTAQQKEQIKALVESGDQLGAQKIILKEVESQVKGSAAAQATGADKARVAWENLQESIGKLLIPVISKLSEVLTPLLQYLSEHQTVLMVLAGIIGGALVAAFAEWAISAGAAAVATLAAAAPVLAIVAAIGLVVAAAYFLWTNWDQVWTWIKDHPAIAIIISILAAPVAAFVLIVGGLHWLYENWDSIWSTIQQVVQIAWDSVLHPIFDLIVNTLAIIGYAATTMKGVWDTMWGGISAAVSAAWAVVDPILSGIIDAVKTVIGWIDKGIKKIQSLGDTGGGFLPGFPTILPNLRFASGGRVPGTGNRDTVPAMLTPGEYVMSKDEVAAAREPSGVPSHTWNVTINTDSLTNPRAYLGEMFTRAREEMILA